MMPQREVFGRMGALNFFIRHLIFRTLNRGCYIPDLKCR